MTPDRSLERWARIAEGQANQAASIYKAVSRAGGLSRMQEIADRYVEGQQEIQRAFERAGGYSYIQGIADKYIAQQQEIQRAFERAGGYSYIQEIADKYVERQRELQMEYARQIPRMQEAAELFARQATDLQIQTEVISRLDAIIERRDHLDSKIQELRDLALSDSVQNIAQSALEVLGGDRDEDLNTLIDTEADQLEQLATDELHAIEHPVRIAVWIALAPTLLILWTHPIYGEWVHDNLPLIVVIVAFTKWAWQEEPR